MDVWCLPNLSDGSMVSLLKIRHLDIEIQMRKYFFQGLGRRKSGRASTIFKPDFIAWIPDEQELKKEGAAMSVYR